jgi:hypothetical protein
MCDWPTSPIDPETYAKARRESRLLDLLSESFNARWPEGRLYDEYKRLFNICPLTRSNPVENKPAAPPSSVQEAFNQTNAQMDTLAGKIGELSTRLSPVMQPETPVAVAPDTPAEGQTCDLEGQVLGHCGRALAMSDTVVGILARLQL